jgi:hypothetical protein
MKMHREASGKFLLPLLSAVVILVIVSAAWAKSSKTPSKTVSLQNGRARVWARQR